MNARQFFTYRIYFVKGVSILAVICAHISSVLYFTGNSENPVDILNVYLFAISRFAVPVFFTLSAFYLALNPKCYHSPSWLYRRRLPHLVIPYFLYTTIYAFPDIIKSTDPAAILLCYLTGNGEYHLWFVFVVIQLYLLHPILYRCFLYFRKRLPFFFTLAIVIQIIWNIAVSISFHYCTNTTGAAYHILSFLNRSVFGSLGYFMAGYELNENADSILNLLRRNRTTILSIGVMVVGAGITVLMWSMGIRPEGSIQPIPFNNVILSLLDPLLGAASFLLLFRLSDWIPLHALPGRIIHTAGLYSYGIYLLHPLFLTKIEIVLNRFLQIEMSNISLYFLTFFFTTILSLLVAKLIVKLPHSRYFA